MCTSWPHSSQSKDCTNEAPAFKKGEKVKPENYPMSLTCSNDVSFVKTGIYIE